MVLREGVPITPPGPEPEPEEEDEAMIINGVWGEYDSEEYECTVTFPNTYDEVKALMLEGKMIYLHIPEETNNDKTIFLIYSPYTILANAYSILF